MTVGLESFLSHINPNPNLSLEKGSMALSHPLSSSSPSRLKALVRSHNYRVSVLSLCVSSKRLGPHFISLDRRRSKNRSIVSFAASHEDSKHSEIKKEKGRSELKIGAEESQEAWQRTLESFKEHAIKMQNMSQEAYELYSKRAMVILKETLEQLKIQAKKARQDLNVIVKGISEEGKEYLSTAAENSHEPMKDIVETFAFSIDNLNEVSKVQDFHLGIPYGVLLSLGGFLSFMLTGSIPAIRFGVILGGTLLALSISSLRSWGRGGSSVMAVKWQAAIACIIFLRELRLLFQRPSFLSSFTTLVSGTMVAFYLFRIMLNGDQKNGSRMEHGPEN